MEVFQFFTEESKGEVFLLNSLDKIDLISQTDSKTNTNYLKLHFNNTFFLHKCLDRNKYGINACLFLY